MAGATAGKESWSSRIVLQMSGSPPEGCDSAPATEVVAASCFALISAAVNLGLGSGSKWSAASKDVLSSSCQDETWQGMKGVLHI